ncbi:MarR family winged helix-turn-helix transcriptional regulator [Streptomyces sp. PU-14G]|uniref:MarR family winged helix-turn-helix transcriptional regulator n=1 Tax=Streptomyces sp. PU-14G TaxID=2800808 RepID=UPI0034E04BC5
MQTSSTDDEQRIEQAARGLLSGIGRLSRLLFRTGDFGLPRSSATALDALEEGPRRVSELTSHTGLTQPRVTTVLKELETRGLVERRSCARDGRATEAHLTPLGRELLERGRRRMAAALLEGLHAHADDPEHTVAVAREAVCTLLTSLESEAS